MIKIIMNSGDAYELNLKNIEEFKEKYLKNNNIENKIVTIKEGISINLMAISSIQEESHIDEINTIMP